MRILVVLFLLSLSLSSCVTAWITYNITGFGSNSTWSLIAGSTSAGMPARNTGNQRQASSAVSPGRFRGGCSTIDPITNMIYIFGGCRFSQTGSCGETLSDISNNEYVSHLWGYDPSAEARNWVFLSGSLDPSEDSCCASTTINTNYTSYPANPVPGPRVSCQIAAYNGVVFLFGGFGKGEVTHGGGTIGMIGDMWYYYIVRSSSTNFIPTITQWASGIFTSSTTNFNLGSYTQPGSFTGSSSPFRMGGALHFIKKGDQDYLFLHGGSAVNSTAQYAIVFGDTWMYRLSDRKWSWVAGVSTKQAAIFPDLTPPPNSPGSIGTPYFRTKFASCVSPDRTKVFIFGGVTRNQTSHIVLIADLWMFDALDLQWRYLSGTPTNQTGSYGLKNVENPNNLPSARRAAACWVDTDLNFYLFGGFTSVDDTNNQSTNSLNDVWLFRRSSFSWTWIDGSSSGGNPGSKTFPMSRIPGSLTWQGSNTIMLFGGYRTGVNSPGTAVDYGDIWELQYSFVNFTLNCSDGYFLSGGNTAASCLACNPGRYQAGIMPNCSDCPEGSFSSGAASSCSSCDVGTYSSAQGASTCAICPEGRFSLSNASACTPCNNGSYTSLQGKSQCDVCIAGRFAAGAASSCSACDIGFFASTQGKSQCDMCSPGTWMNASGASNCTNCAEGRFSLWAASSCTPCTNGTYASEHGKSQCDLCSPGRWVNTSGSSTCITCAEGRFSLGAASSCSPCNGGTYAPVQGKSQCDVCPPGRFSFDAASSCTSCDVGTYASTPGKSQCDMCPSGRWMNTSGASVCTICSEGRVSLGAASLCNPCNIGSYVSGQGKSQCDLCMPGKWQNTSGASSCSVCSQGTYSGAGSVNCISCPAGSYGDVGGLSSCSLCSLGRYSSQPGRSTCDLCSIPLTSRVLGSDKCLPCSLGEYFIAPDACGKCHIGSYANETGLTVCYSCFKSTTVTAGSISSDDCSICDAGFYGKPPQPCQPCSQARGITCPSGSKLPLISAGYYRAGMDGDEVNVAFECKPESSCLETGDKFSTPCAEGYTGYLCGLCGNNFYRLEQSCKRCPSDAVKWITITLALIVLSFIIFRITTKKSQLPPDVRVTVQATQIIALFPTISTKWPKEILIIMQIYSVTNVNIELFSPECAAKMSFWDKYYGKMLLPLFFAGVFSFVVGSRLFYLNFVRKSLDVEQRKIEQNQIKRKMFSLFSFIIVAFYTFLIQSAVQPFNCSLQANGKYLLIKNPSEFCFSDTWNKNLPLVVLFLILYGIGLPAILSYSFYKSRKDLDNPIFNMRFGPLITPYKRRFFYWELVIMLRRAVFIVSNDLLSSSTAYSTRYPICIALLLSFVWIDTVSQPYLTKEFNMFAVSWGMVSILTLLCQGFVFEADEIDSSIQYAFAIICALLLVSTAVFALISIIARVVRNNVEIIFTKKACTMLSEGSIHELFYIYSLQKALTLENFELEKVAFKKYLDPYQIQELTDIVQAIGKVGEERFQAIAAKARKHIEVEGYPATRSSSMDISAEGAKLTEELERKFGTQFGGGIQVTTKVYIPSTPAPE